MAPTADRAHQSRRWLGPISIINLHRPDRKNAFGRIMTGQLREAIDAVGASSAQVVILRSRVERCFSAGADLKERAEMAPEEVGPFVDSLRNTFGMIEALPMPSIAAIDGVALGGGFELSLCCDLRYVGPHAKIGLPETRLAILPAAGGSQRLSRLIGASAAKELIFMAAVLGPQEARQYGLVNGPSGRLEESPSSVAPGAFDKAMEVARRIAANGPLAIRQAKVAIDHGSQADLYTGGRLVLTVMVYWVCRATGLLIEKLAYAQLIPTEDRLEGLRAFREGRQPVYKGK